MFGVAKDAASYTIRSVADAVHLLSVDDESFSSKSTGPHRGWTDCLDRMRQHHGNAAGFGLWFRGQPNAAKPLLPTLFRDGTYFSERTIYLQFQSKVGPTRECGTIFDWLCLGRHHYLPSRLLDWSENLLNALYFAVRTDETDDKQPGRLFILDAHMLNKVGDGLYGVYSSGYASVILRAEMTLADDVNIILERLAHGDCDLGNADSHSLLGKLTGPTKQEELSRLANPVAVFPSRVDPRMTAQQSVFTIHGGKRKSPKNRTKSLNLPEPVSFDALDRQTPPDKRFMFSFVVEDKARIRQELRYLGIHEASLFPDLDHQAADLARTWCEPDTRTNRT